MVFYSALLDFIAWIIIGIIKVIDVDSREWVNLVSYIAFNIRWLLLKGFDRDFMRTLLISAISGFYIV